MKKVLAILLVLTFVLSLTACGNKEEASSDTGVSSTITSTEGDGSSSETTNNESTGDATTSDATSGSSSEQNTSKPTENSKPADTSKPSTSTTSKPTDTSKPTETHTHTWGNWSIETEALVGKDGTEKRTCSGCDEVERRSTKNSALYNSFYHDYLQAYFIAIDNGLDYPSPFATKGLFASGDYMALFTHGSATGTNIPAEEYYNQLKKHFVLNDEMISQMKAERGNQTTYSFPNSESPNVTHEPVGYTKDGQNSYTVYYERFGGGDRNFKVKMEYNLINGKPNKYLSIEQIGAIPASITK